jgi:hypothetical protein
MVRPVKAEDLRRGRPVGVRFTPEEYAVVQAKAAASSSSCLSEYVRNAALDRPIPRGDTTRAEGQGLTLSFAIANELRRVGVNLNQIARLSHMGIERSDELTPLLDDLRRILACLQGEGGDA